MNLTARDCAICFIAVAVLLGLTTVPPAGAQSDDSAPRSSPAYPLALRVNNPAPTDTHADAASIAVSSAGTIHVVWEEHNRTTDMWHVMYARLRAGDSTFSEKTSLAQCEVWTGSSPAVASWGPRIQIAYELDPLCSASHILVRTSQDDGMSFGPEISLPNTTAGFNRRPDIVVAPNGGTYVLWTQGQTGEAWLEVSRSTDGGLTFEPPVQVNPVHNFSQEFDAVVDSFGGLHVVWFDAVTPGQTWEDLYYSNAGSSLSFSPMKKIDGVATQWHSTEFPTAFAVPGTNRILAAWADTRNYPPLGGGYDLFLVESGDGGETWQPQVQVTRSPPGVTEWTPVLASDESGRVYVAWADERGFYAAEDRGWDVYLARSEDGVSFEEWLIDAVTAFDQRAPDLVFRSNVLHLVFTDRSAGRMRGASPLADIRYVQVDPPPSSPSLSYADLRPYEVTLVWSRSSDSDFDRYEVQWAEGNASFATVFMTFDAAVNSTPVTGLSENTRYLARVLVFDRSGSWSSSLDLEIVTPNAPPARPILSLVVTTPTSATLRWSKDGSSDFREYDLELSEVPDFASSLAYLRFRDRNATEHSFDQMMERTSYYARVTVKDEHGALNASSVVSWTSPNGAPEPVRILTSYATGSDTLFLSWENSYAGDFSAYEIFVSDSPALRGDRVAVVPDVFTTNTPLTGLEPNSTYWLSVAVVDSGGLRAFSEPIAATTLPQTDGPSGPSLDVASWSIWVVAAVSSVLAGLAVWRRLRSRAGRQQVPRREQGNRGRR